MADRHGRRPAAGLRDAGSAIGMYLRAAPAYAATRLAVTAASGLAPVATAWLTRTLLDDLAAHRTSRVALLATALALLGGFMAAGQHLTRYTEREIGRRVTLSAQGRLFAAVTAQHGLARLEDPAYHDSVRLAQQAGQNGPQMLASAVLAIVQSALTIAGFAVSLWTLSPLVTMAVLASAVPTLAAQITLARQRRTAIITTSPRFRRQLFYSLLMLDLRAAKEIRLFGLGDHFRERMLDELRAAQSSERAVDRSTFAVDGSLSVLTAAISGVALYGVSVRISDGRGAVGDLAVLVAALAGVQGALAGVVAQIATAAQLLPLFHHYSAVVRTPADIVGTGPAPMELAEGIRFEDVWFRYDESGPWILSGVDLMIPAGRSLALVGLNGAGKSTLVKLLCRLYEPCRGAITWDGVDIRDIDPTQLRRKIAAVFQDFMCYELSARENIVLGNLAAADDSAAVERSARAAGVHDFVTSLPAGYDTMLSRTFEGAPPPDGRAAREGPASGTVLSGGQWQRIALARAFLRPDAELLILDEPASGLDAEAEAALHGGLRDLRGGRTSLVISHRMNSVRAADQIVVLDRGRVVEAGDHEMLMARDGRYARLFRIQAAGYRSS